MECQEMRREQKQSLFNFEKRILDIEERDAFLPSATILKIFPPAVEDHSMRDKFVQTEKKKNRRMLSLHGGNSNH